MQKLIRRCKKFLKSKRKLQDLTIYLRRARFITYPKSAGIEVAGICNLRCPVCEFSNSSVRPKGVMSVEQFDRIISEIGPYLKDLVLSGGGEPFISKNIYSILSLARKKAPKAYIYIDTNGHFLDVDKLFESPPDEIVFSIDGFDQDTYSYYRINGVLDKVIENLNNCVAKKISIKAEKPKIVIKFICMKHNEHQVAMVPEFAKRVGADDYRIELFTSRTVEHARKYMSSKPEYQNYDVDKLNQNILVPFMEQLGTPCPMPWANTEIYWNGEIVPCCTDHDCLYSFGNVFQTGGFWEIWNGKKAYEFRKKHEKRVFRNELSICKGCYLTNCVLKEEKQVLLNMQRAGRSSISHEKK